MSRLVISADGRPGMVPESLTAFVLDDGIIVFVFITLGCRQLVAGADPVHISGPVHELVRGQGAWQSQKRLVVKIDEGIHPGSDHKSSAQAHSAWSCCRRKPAPTALGVHFGIETGGETTGN